MEEEGSCRSMDFFRSDERGAEWADRSREIFPEPSGICWGSSPPDFFGHEVGFNWMSREIKMKERKEVKEMKKMPVPRKEAVARLEGNRARRP